MDIKKSFSKTLDAVNILKYITEKSNDFEKIIFLEDLVLTDYIQSRIEDMTNTCLSINTRVSLNNKYVDINLKDICYKYEKLLSSSLNIKKHYINNSDDKWFKLLINSSNVVNYIEDNRYELINNCFCVDYEDFSVDPSMVIKTLNSIPIYFDSAEISDTYNDYDDRCDKADYCKDDGLDDYRYEEDYIYYRPNMKKSVRKSIPNVFKIDFDSLFYTNYSYNSISKLKYISIKYKYIFDVIYHGLLIPAITFREIVHRVTHGDRKLDYRQKIKFRIEKLSKMNQENYNTIIRLLDKLIGTIFDLEYLEICKSKFSEFNNYDDVLNCYYHYSVYTREYGNEFIDDLIEKINYILSIEKEVLTGKRNYYDIERSEDIYKSIIDTIKRRETDYLENVLKKEFEL